MSTCSNCYNGCTEIISDKCVKYTGPNITALGITNGDTLSAVEKAITDYLVPVLSGVGVIPIISNSIICETVSKYLPDCSVCTGFTLNQILTATISAICDLQEQVTAIDATLDVLNADYDISCLTGVTSSSDTHAVVQAIIKTLCTLNTDFNLLLAALPNTYVSINDIDTYIQTYLNNVSGGALYSSRMVPYGVVSYYGPLTNFDSTGAGIGNWDRIFLCNGNNGTPDLRGRVIVGAINGVPGPTMNPAVDPTVSGNPNYSLGSVAGVNQVTLSLPEMPNHNHNLISNVTTDVDDPGHSHTIPGAGSGQGGIDSYNNGLLPNLSTSSSKTLITVDVTVDVTCQNNGGGLPHTNIQPVNAAYYIIYLP
jgi:microcystin-dependent protein